MIACEMRPISRLFYLCLIIVMVTNLFSDNKSIKRSGIILGLVCILILIKVQPSLLYSFQQICNGTKEDLNFLLGLLTSPTNNILAMFCVFRYLSFFFSFFFYFQKSSS